MVIKLFRSFARKALALALALGAAPIFPLSASRTIRLISLFCLPILGWSAEISKDTAQQVAENFLSHYVATYGQWGDSASPAIVDIELIRHENAPIAYNVKVNPQGHLLVPYFDEFTPVMLYSDRSSFIAARVSERGSVESWILPEMSNAYKTIRIPDAGVGVGADARTAAQADGYAKSEVAKAWAFYRLAKGATGGAGADGFSKALTTSTVGPLLTTNWDQGDPTTAPFTYNLYTPAGSTCTHTYTGCVATAWSQLLKYWNWPDVGVGSHTYTLNGQTRSANFAHAYDWANMPNQLTASSTATQIQAVARLISDMGIAVDMDYACDGSSSDMYADNPSILPAHFKYKTGALQINRGSYTAAQWFSFFKAEFDAAPPRPLIFSIFSTAGDGHEIVSDGYRTGATNYVHVNMGWSGYYNGYYDVTNNWTTGSDTWKASDQVIVTGLIPDKTVTGTPPQCTLAASPASLVLGSSAILTASCSPAATSFAWAAATGLLPGSGNTATVTPTTAGTFTYAVTGSNTAGAGNLASVSVIVSNAPSPSTNLLSNPGFESGATAWTQVSSGGHALISNEASIPAHSGTYYATLGGYNSATDTIEQSVRIPANVKTANVNFWYWISTSETSASTAYDFLKLELYSTAGLKLATLSTLSNLNTSSGWVKSATFDVSAYKGQSIRLRFTATTDASNSSRFLVDDVSLSTTPAAFAKSLAPILMLLLN